MGYKISFRYKMGTAINFGSALALAAKSEKHAVMIFRNYFKYHDDGIKREIYKVERE